LFNVQASEGVGGALDRQPDLGVLHGGDLALHLLQVHGLDVEDVEGDLEPGFGDLGRQGVGGHVAGEVGQLLHAIGERGLDEHPLEVFGMAGLLPDPLGGPGVPGVDEAAPVVGDDEAHGGHRVADRDGPDAVLVQLRRAPVGQGPELEDRGLVVGDGGKIGPDLVVEQVLPQAVQHLRHGQDLDGSLEAAHQVVGHQQQAQAVVDVDVGEEDRLDPLLLLEVHHGGGGPGVDQDAPVQKEAGEVQAGEFGARCAQDADLHNMVSPAIPFCCLPQGGLWA